VDVVFATVQYCNQVQEGGQQCSCFKEVGFNSGKIQFISNVHGLKELNSMVEKDGFFTIKQGSIPVDILPEMMKQ